MKTTTSAAGSTVRLLTIAVLALVLGLMAMNEAAARPARGVSVGDRVQAQKDLCFVSGGTFESKEYYGSYTNGHQLQKTVTTCKGGKNPQTCTNTKSDTTCTQGFVLPPQSPADSGMIDEVKIGGIETASEPEVIVDDGSIRGGQIEPISNDGGAPAPVPTKLDRSPVITDIFVIEPLP